MVTMPLPVKILRSTESGSSAPGSVPLWAETGTADGRIAPPAVSSEVTKSASSSSGS